MELKDSPFLQYNAVGTEIGECSWIREPCLMGSSSLSVSLEAVCSMNIILKSDVLPRISINTIITTRLLEIPFFLFQFVMVKWRIVQESVARRQHEKC